MIKNLILKKSRSVLIRLFPLQMGYVIRPKGSGYFDAAEIVAKAEEEGLSVCEYLETNNIGGVGKRRDSVIDALAKAGVMHHHKTIVEIGTGTGMYLEKFIEICKPLKYEVYETNVGWTAYLKRKYASGPTNLVLHNADGHSLGYTPDGSADMVTAHGVFVYLPIISTFQYLKEAVRVCKKDGYIIFDCFTEKVLTIDDLSTFREKNVGHDWPVIMSEAQIEAFCAQFNLKIQHTFITNFHYVRNIHYILRKC